MREDLFDQRLLEDRSKDLQLTVSVRAALYVDLEHALEQLGQAQPHWAVERANRLALDGQCGLGRRLWLLWYSLGAQLGVGCQDAIERAPLRGSAAVPPASDSSQLVPTRCHQPNKTEAEQCKRAGFGYLARSQCSSEPLIRR